MDCKALKENLDRAADFLRPRMSAEPEAALFLGTGLGSFADRLARKTVIPYQEIPGFPRPSAFGQSNAVVLGTAGGRGVLSFEGRFHAYEGHPFWEIGFPVRLAHALGARVFIGTNIAGGVNLEFKRGEFAAVEDHLYLMGDNPLRGPHEPWMGERFVDLSEPYDPELICLASRIFEKKKIKMKKGVYAAVAGPQLETRAEYRYLAKIGADLVGMSTVPEVLVARQLGMKVFVLSLVSDECDPDHLEPVNIADLLETAGRASGVLAEFLAEFIEKLPEFGAVPV